MPTIAITATTEKLIPLAQNLAQKIRVPFVSANITDYDFLLIFTANHLELKETSSRDKALYVDFFHGKSGYRYVHGGGYDQMLAKAIGIKKNLGLTVLDATAGLGQDAFVLASLGCEVILIEKSPIIAALLADGLDRAEDLLTEKNIKMTLIEDNAISFMQRLNSNQKPDVIYLDPMYPHRIKSALVKKEMRIIRSLIGDDLDSSELLATALKFARKRVVVKRPRLAPNIVHNIKPDIVYSGKSCRFDVYIINPKPEAIIIETRQTAPL
jgi:16S rRNA (guanine1516-N2)-methyltransferase